MKRMILCLQCSVKKENYTPENMKVSNLVYGRSLAMYRCVQCGKVIYEGDECGAYTSIEKGSVKEYTPWEDEYISESGL